jgi:hypothetical protein
MQTSNRLCTRLFTLETLGDVSMQIMRTLIRSIHFFGFNITFYAVLAATVQGLALLSNATYAGPVVWIAADGNGNAYDFISGNLSWYQAAAAAESLSFQGEAGHLATITSAAENAFLLTNFGDSSEERFAWIGGSEPLDDGVWRWASGPEMGIQFAEFSSATSPLNYANWGGSEPNDAQSGEDFAMFNIGQPFRGILPGKWADATPTPSSSDPVKGYFVEYETRLPTFPPRPPGIEMQLGKRSIVRDGEILEAEFERDGLLIQAGEEAPFNSFHGCEGCDPGRFLDVDFQFNYSAQSVAAATISVGLFDHDAWADGQQIGFFGFDDVDLTESLNAIVERRPNYNFQYNIYEIEIPVAGLDALSDGVAKFSLRYSGRSTNKPRPASNYGLIDFATLTIWPTSVPEPSTFAMLLTTALGVVMFRHGQSRKHAMRGSWFAVVLALSSASSVTAQTATIWEINDLLHSKGLPSHLSNGLSLTDGASMAVVGDLALSPIPLLVWQEGSAPMSLGYFSPPVAHFNVSRDGSTLSLKNELTGDIILWTDRRGIEVLKVTAPDGTSVDHINSLSADGTRFAGMHFGPSGQGPGLDIPMIWDESTGASTLGVRGGGPIISADGTTIAFQNLDIPSAGGGSISLWRESTGVVPIAGSVSAPPWFVSSISEFGDAVVWQANVTAQNSVWLWQEGKGNVLLEGFGLGGAGATSFTSPHGERVYGRTNSDFTGVGSGAAVWDEEHGTRVLQDVLVSEYGLGDVLASWHLKEVRHITSDGIIMGRAINPAGDNVEFALVFEQVPEPSSAVTLLLGAACNLSIRRRCQDRL